MMTVTRLHYQVTAENRVERNRHRPFEHSCNGTYLHPSTSGFPRHYHSAILYHQRYTLLPADTVISYRT